MPRTELHSETMPIEQKPTISDDPDEYEGDVVLVDPSIAIKEYAAALAFNEEPLIIRIEPSSEKNASNVFPIWCNGKGAEILINGRWIECAHLPVGQVFTTKRKYVEILVRAKVDRLETNIVEQNGDMPNNKVSRFSSAVHSFSVIEDRNPRGVEWMTELRRRNY